jgi:hypothetical protein
MAPSIRALLRVPSRHGVYEQRLIGNDVPGFRGCDVRSRRGFIAGGVTAAPQTQFWSMRETYSGSVTLSSIKILGFHLSKKCLEQRGLAGEFDRLSASFSCPVAARFFS